MDLAKVLAQLHEELEHLNAAILSLERLRTEEPTRGRPPKALSDVRKIEKARRAGKNRAQPEMDGSS